MGNSSSSDYNGRWRRDDYARDRKEKEMKNRYWQERANGHHGREQRREAITRGYHPG